LAVETVGVEPVHSAAGGEFEFVDVVPRAAWSGPVELLAGRRLTAVAYALRANYNRPRMLALKIAVRSAFGH
jgi:hypothetical protein